MTKRKSESDSEPEHDDEVQPEPELTHRVRTHRPHVLVHGDITVTPDGVDVSHEQLDELFAAAAANGVPVSEVK